MENSQVKVRIYGQDYIVSSERDAETIVAIADYVDEKIRKIGKFFIGRQPGALATLAAVNVADEFFQERTKAEQLQEEKDQLEKDVQHYMDMWEEVKKNFLQYKEGTAKVNDDIKEMEEKCRQLEEKCTEFENSYFELKMENLQLKEKLNKMER